MALRYSMLVLGIAAVSVTLSGTGCNNTTNDGGFPAGLPIERVSVADGGAGGNGTSSQASISSDGRYAAFKSSATNLVAGDTKGCEDIFVYDRQNDTIHLMSQAGDGTQGDGLSEFPSISADGRYVTFESDASNLVAGDDNGMKDVFAAPVQ
jgi:Tol biopolymer transport system component